MGLSKSTRICILLAIDTVFFLIELITGQSTRPFWGRATITDDPAGYAVHSLALVADSFHMVSRSFSCIAASKRLTQTTS